jgi:hypothetical protein
MATKDKDNIEDLHALSRSVHAVIAEQDGMKSRSKFIAKLSNIETDLDIPKTKGTFKLRKAADKIGSIRDGIVQGLEDQTLSLKELRSLLTKNLASALTEFDTAVNLFSEGKVEEEPAPVKISHAPSNDFKAVLQAIGDELRALDASREKTKHKKNDDELTTNQTKAFLSSLKDYRSKLPSIPTKKGFSLMRLPLIPIFVPTSRKLGTGSNRPSSIQAQPATHHLLKQVGIRTIKLEEYQILEDQLILIIEKNNPEVAKMGADGYAKYILSVLSANLNKNLALVDEEPIPNPRSKEMVLFWIMPSKTLSFLKSKGFPKLRTWGLPF